jgi:hypothetical protein
MTEADYVAGLVQRGLPLHIAQGFVTNFKDESGLNPGINEVAPLVPGSRGGYGLYQLTGPRRRAYEAWAGKHGFDLADPNAQMDFLMLELGTTEKAAWDKISATTTPGDAAAAIVNSFLRPAESHRAARERRYRGGDVTTATASAPPPQQPAQGAAGPSPENALARFQTPLQDAAPFMNAPNALAAIQPILPQRTNFLSGRA